MPGQKNISNHWMNRKKQQAAMLFFGSNNPNHYPKIVAVWCAGDISFYNNCIISSGFLSYANPLPDDINFSLIWTPFFPALSIPVFSIRLPKSVHSSFPRCSSNHRTSSSTKSIGPWGFWHRNPTLYRPSYIGLARSWETTITVSCIMIVQISFLRLNRKTDFANMALLKSIVPIRL